ncbi:MAG: hypothetical protein M3541_12630 [Acidobacteriota bacterium]|nr:hypothetical protein [Acidobacteriota bacterium]
MDVAEGRKESPLLTEAVRPTVHKDERLKGLKTFEFVECREVQGWGGVQLREGAGQICYYRGEVGAEVWGFTFWLTPDGKVADFHYP